MKLLVQALAFAEAILAPIYWRILQARERLEIAALNREASR